MMQMSFLSEEYYVPEITHEGIVYRKGHENQRREKRKGKIAL